MNRTGKVIGLRCSVSYFFIETFCRESPQVCVIDFYITYCVPLVVQYKITLYITEIDGISNVVFWNTIIYRTDTLAKTN